MESELQILPKIVIAQLQPRMNSHNMKVKTLKRTGWILILCGLVGGGTTAAEMMTIRLGETIDSPPVLAEAISGTLASATIGSLLALTGLVMVLLGWWRGRPRKQPTAFPKISPPSRSSG